ncbi:hypothetical protein [Oscillatoria nigro-viridis]|uniref:hypothetical protein n=1 Tax=Phormidium nigroviride TaxID=482564 RepID=UPI0002D46B43|nr:hypothetical protein [Oscillatoria nigro-viridis]
MGRSTLVNLKQYRAIATRYHKRAANILGAIYLAASVIWLNLGHDKRGKKETTIQKTLN